MDITDGTTQTMVLRGFNYFMIAFHFLSPLNLHFEGIGSHRSSFVRIIHYNFLEQDGFTARKET